MSQALAVIDEPEPWQRLPKETAPAWNGFNVYRNQPPPRTVRRASEEYAQTTRRNVETVYTQFSVWSRKHDWVGRADAFDLMLDRRRIEARETERQRIDREQMLEGRFIRQSAITRFTGRPGTETQGQINAIDWNELDPDQVLAAYRVGRDTERQAAGLQIGSALGMMPVAHARQVVDEIFALAIEFIPEDRRQSFVQRVQAIAEGR